jgi:3-oxoacyl-[acyl-carrier protein] reductase
LQGKQPLLRVAVAILVQQVAMKLASEGANVAINYFASSAGADGTVAAIKGVGGNAFALRGDLNKQKDVDALVRKGRC